MAGVGFWDFLIGGLLLGSLAFLAFTAYRWWSFRKKLSYTRKLIGMRVEDLFGRLLPKGGAAPINIPKKGEVVLFFYGPKCRLCPKQEEEIKKLPKNLKVFKLDVRTKRGKILAALFRVAVLPSVIVLKDREIKGYFTAFTTADKILKSLQD
jgi:hypothetical protein